MRAFWAFAVAVTSSFESEVRAFWLVAVAVELSFESGMRAFWLIAVDGFYRSIPTVYTRSDFQNCPQRTVPSYTGYAETRRITSLGLLKYPPCNRRRWSGDNWWNSDRGWGSKHPTEEFCHARSSVRANAS
ncbi:MAG: hypothetical protein V5A24_05805 [Haloarculaceae archaeon]